ncbi:uncharacterized protein C8Q71DRAFT_910851 [Rhodofomes roseus]|uniref:F-box domain-containing protein n=1 Tax=Rhodofomes roseus TaxID=34475 RepID=A0ABQ8K2Y5_9APHY|nr:uncharacterized protein C8Q71DRAFT_910851 [Rhodofomes roseus]KAH9831200.1 hypothetical protein C8Q71DRAFT_910851 [Rhodofomes roseus]
MMDVMRMPSPALLSLPTELIVRILAHLPCPVLLTFRSTSRFCRALIDADTSLQYAIELCATGAVDNPASRYVLADRLRILKERESAWQRMEFSRVAQIQVPHNPSSIYDLTGGMFLLGESYSRILPTWRPTDAARYLNLRAALKNSENATVLDGPWARIDVNAKIMDVGIAAQEHDLIAIVTYTYIEVNEFLAELKIHLVKLSTGGHHPAASQPVIQVPRMPFLPGNCSVSIEIVGDTLGVLFNLSRFLHGAGMTPIIAFYLYDWKTGKLKSTRTANSPHYNAFCFLSPDVIVLPNVTTHALELCSIADQEGESAEPAPLQTLCTLGLPRAAPSTLFHRIWCRAEPNALATRNSTFADAPFFTDPARAVIIFNVVAQDMTHGTLHYLSLVVHRSSLLARLAQCVSPRSANTTPTTPTAPGLQPPRVEWPAWGPPACLWLDGDGLAIRWITVTCGQRFVVMSRESPAPIQIYDFNPRAGARRTQAARAQGRLVHETTERDVDVDAKSGARTVFVRRATLLSTIFEEPVRSEMPYMITETGEWYDYESVMMDEGVLIGVEQLDEETDNIGSLVLHAVGPVA